MRESPEAALLRWDKLERLQRHYREFIPFLTDMMEELGFSTTEIQAEIGMFLQYGPQYLMVQAQRGEAKTTITAIFAVWCIIHNPKIRILILSAGEAQANEISTLVVKFITTIDILECLKPDRSNGDRTSVEAFDVHYSLKGVDKSPTVACCGITANLQGKRADLLIADDVESAKNSKTAALRELLLHITKDFTSISLGRIVYLGTPQSIQSIYNTLPSRGFTIRVWPGRYPTADQLDKYGVALAPSIRAACERDPARMSGHGLDGKQGAPTDPELFDDEKLCKKELDQGQAYFQLQHMLLTELADSMRYPLKTHSLCVMRLDTDTVPLTVVRGMDVSKRAEFSIGDSRYACMRPHALSDAVAQLSAKVMYVDPAGGGANADETGYAIMGLLNSNLFLYAVGGIPGGYDKTRMETLAALVVKHRPGVLKIEKNFGYGAFREVLVPVVREACEKAGVPCPAIEDDLVTGQKELRLIGTLEPIMGRGALIINEAIFEEEAASLARYDVSVRNTYSFFHQLAFLTRDKGALVHDDRLDAVEGAARHFVAALAVDQQKRIDGDEKRRFAEWQKNPLGYRHLSTAIRPSGTSASRRLGR